MEAKYIKKLWKLKDYEKVKGDLFIRVLNIKRNRDILDGGIYVVQDDFALVVCQKLDEAENERVSVTVPAGFLDEWGKTREEVLKTAYENTTEMLFVRLIGMDEVTEEPYSAGKELWEVEASEKKDDHGYCLGLGSEGLGCAWVFIPGNIEKVCRAMGAEEVYIVPLSVNEAVFHDVRKITDMENLWRSFWDTVASYIPAEEFLTVHIYRYSMKTGKLTTIMPDEGVIKSYQQGKDSKWRKEYLDMQE